VIENYLLGIEQQKNIDLMQKTQYQSDDKEANKGNTGVDNTS